MIDIGEQQNCDTSGWLFYMNCREELEVLILGLEALDGVKMDDSLLGYRDMCLSTLKSQLWNRYYRWDEKNAH